LKTCEVSRAGDKGQRKDGEKLLGSVPWGERLIESCTRGRWAGARGMPRSMKKDGKCRQGAGRRGGRIGGRCEEKGSGGA